MVCGEGFFTSLTLVLVSGIIIYTLAVCICERRNGGEERKKCVSVPVHMGQRNVMREEEGLGRAGAAASSTARKGNAICACLSDILEPPSSYPELPRTMGGPHGARQSMCELSRTPADDGRPAWAE